MGSLVRWSLEPPWKKSDYLKAGEGQLYMEGPITSELQSALLDFIISVPALDT